MAKFTTCKSENGEEILAFTLRNVKEGSIIHSDKGKGFGILADIYKDYDGKAVIGEDENPIQKYPYILIQEKSDKVSNPMKWIHTLISNLKSELLGIFHGIPIAYMELYLAEFEWRYNHRYIRSSLHKMHEIMKSALNVAKVTQKDIQFKFSVTA